MKKMQKLTKVLIEEGKKKFAQLEAMVQHSGCIVLVDHDEDESIVYIYKKAIDLAVNCGWIFNPDHYEEWTTPAHNAWEYLSREITGNEWDVRLCQGSLWLIHKACWDSELGPTPSKYEAYLKDKLDQDRMAKIASFKAEMMALMSKYRIEITIELDSSNDTSVVFDMFSASGEFECGYRLEATERMTYESFK